MDFLKELAAKKQDDVVLVMLEVSTAVANSSNNPVKDANLESLQELYNAKPRTPSQEISKSDGMSPKKPPRPLQSGALIHRRSISKPKSRFEEPANPIHNSHLVHDLPSSSPYNGSPNRKDLGTPETPRPDEEEEEEEEVYKKEQLQISGKQRRKWRVWLVIEWMILFLATACLITSLLVQRMQGYVFWGLDLWKWCLMVMVIFCGRLVTHWFINILVFLIEINFLFRKKVLYFIYGLKKSVQAFIWFGLVLLSWSLIFNDNDVPRSPKTAKALNYVSRALASLLIGSVIWLVKKNPFGEDSSISRIVMLAEALFEVMDEIHQQSAVLSSRQSISSIGSIPAPKEVVDNIPMKVYMKSKAHLNQEVPQKAWIY